jgi:hypothetical protein
LQQFVTIAGIHIKMPSWEVQNTYIFSGKFPVLIPESARENLRAMIVDVDLIRRSKNEFYANKTNPPTTFLGTFTTWFGEMPIERRDIIFASQRFIFSDSTDAQLISLLTCSFKGVVDSIQNLGAALNLLPFPSGNFLQEVKALSFLPSTLKFVCYADTGLRVIIRTLKYDVCELENEPAPPPPPSPPPNSIPPGDPITADDGFSDIPDGGNSSDYAPYPGDGEDTTPGGTGNSCDPYRVTITFNIRNELGVIIDTQIAEGDLFGVIGETFVGTSGDGSPTAGVFSQGFVSSQTCGASQQTILTGFSGLAGYTFTEVEIFDIQPL